MIKNTHISLLPFSLNNNSNDNHIPSHPMLLSPSSLASDDGFFNSNTHTSNGDNVCGGWCKRRRVTTP